jgi:hypothetical protein
VFLPDLYHLNRHRHSATAQQINRDVLTAVRIMNWTRSVQDTGQLWAFALMAVRHAIRNCGTHPSQRRLCTNKSANCKCRVPHAPHIHISDYKCERVSGIVYLGSLVNETSDIKEEISKRIQNANRCYSGLLKHFKSRLFTRETKYTPIVGAATHGR